MTITPQITLTYVILSSQFPNARTYGTSSTHLLVPKEGKEEKEVKGRLRRKRGNIEHRILEAHLIPSKALTRLPHAEARLGVPQAGFFKLSDQQ